MPPRVRADPSPPWSEARLKAVERRSFTYKKMQEKANARLSPQEILAKIRAKNSGGVANNSTSVPARNNQDKHVPPASDLGDKNLIFPQHSTISSFKHAELSKATSRIRSLGTASDQQHLRYKETVYLLRRRKAYLSLRNDVWRMGKAEIFKAAARRCWGRTPDHMTKLLDGERLPLEKFYNLWPEPFDQLAAQWDEIYLKEFPEVVDRDVWGQPEWEGFYTPFSRDFMAAPSAHVRRLMRWEPKPNYVREIPNLDNLPAHLNAALLALGVEAPRSTSSHGGKMQTEPRQQKGQTAKEPKYLGNHPASTAAAAASKIKHKASLQRKVAAGCPNSGKKISLKEPTLETPHRLPGLTAQYKRPHETTGSNAAVQQQSQKGLKVSKLYTVGKRERCKGGSRHREKREQPTDGRKGRQALARKRSCVKRKPKKARATRLGEDPRAAGGGPPQVALPHGGGPLSPISVPESSTTLPVENGVPEASLWWDPSRPYSSPDTSSMADLSEPCRC